MYENRFLIKDYVIRKWEKVKDDEINKTVYFHD